ncbi:MAG TPA: hypothetical protein VIT20_07115 [Propionibacteriaceae bacterium]
MLRTWVVRAVKPVLSEAAWDWLRHLDPGARRRDAERAVREARRLERRANDLSTRRLSEPSLTELAKHFKTDKWGRHRYTPHYQRHLRHLKKQTFTLFEIGIGGYSRAGEGGASLRMWKAYFPKAQLLGLDIEDKSFVDEERIRSFQGSQVDATLLAEIVAGAENLQVIIDDGSHVSAHIVETFAILFPLLPEGGIYVIEDTQTSYWERYGGSTDLNDPRTSMNMVKAMLDGLNYEEWTAPGYEPTYAQLHVVAVHAYHNLIFIEKGRNDEEAVRRARPGALPPG